MHDISTVLLAKKHRVVQKQIRALAAFILQREKVGAAAINIVLVSKGQMQELNRTYKKHDYDTDVLSFRLDEGREGEPILGEVIISLDCVKAQCREFGNSFLEELQFCVAHGVLHVLGYDDRTVEERAAMHKRQAVLIRKWEMRSKK